MDIYYCLNVINLAYNNLNAIYFLYLENYLVKIGNLLFLKCKLFLLFKFLFFKTFFYFYSKIEFETIDLLFYLFPLFFLFFENKSEGKYFYLFLFFEIIDLFLLRLLFVEIERG